MNFCNPNQTGSLPLRKYKVNHIDGLRFSFFGHFGHIFSTFWKFSSSSRKCLQKNLSILYKTMLARFLYVMWYKESFALQMITAISVMNQAYTL